MGVLTEISCSWHYMEFSNTAGWGYYVKLSITAQLSRYGSNLVHMLFDYVIPYLYDW